MPIYRKLVQGPLYNPDYFEIKYRILSHPQDQLNKALRNVFSLYSFLFRN